jgi:hypothetical protein
MLHCSPSKRPFVQHFLGSDDHIAEFSDLGISE